MVHILSDGSPRFIFCIQPLIYKIILSIREIVVSRSECSYSSKDAHPRRAARNHSIINKKRLRKTCAFLALDSSCEGEFFPYQRTVCEAKGGA